MSLTLSAPAKLNLFLRITGRRPDGYHLIQSLMVKLDLHDQLQLSLEGDHIRLSLDGLQVPADETNLVFRAAGLFLRETGLAGGCRIHLTKNIPIAAGLGGGSADAAATLIGLNRLADRPLSPEQLHALGTSLGADIPFFLQPASTAWAEGIGEILQPGPVISPDYFLLINPGWPLSTSEVFRAFNFELTKRRHACKFTGLIEWTFDDGRNVFNDLEEVVTARYPEIVWIKERLLALGARAALMTGSGPTVFGVYNDAASVANAFRLIMSEAQSGWIVHTARSLPFRTVPEQSLNPFRLDCPPLVAVHLK